MTRLTPLILALLLCLPLAAPADVQATAPPVQRVPTQAALAAGAPLLPPGKLAQAGDTGALYVGQAAGGNRAVSTPLTLANIAAALGYTPLDAAALRVQSLNGRSGAVSLLSSDVTGALGFSPLAGIPAALVAQTLALSQGRIDLADGPYAGFILQDPFGGLVLRNNGPGPLVYDAPYHLFRDQAGTTEFTANSGGLNVAGFVAAGAAISAGGPVTATGQIAVNSTGAGSLVLNGTYGGTTGKSFLYEAADSGTIWFHNRDISGGMYGTPGSAAAMVLGQSNLGNSFVVANFPGGGYTPALAVRYNGDVGINLGFGAPAARLHVVGADPAKPSLRLDTAPGQAASGIEQRDSVGAVRFGVSASGQVTAAGVTTTAPGYTGSIPLTAQSIHVSGGVIVGFVDSTGATVGN